MSAQPLDVLAVMDADGRAIALLCDLTVNRVQESWLSHLPAHDEARAAVAELIEALKLAHDHLAPMYESLDGTPHGPLVTIRNALDRCGGAP